MIEPGVKLQIRVRKPGGPSYELACSDIILVYRVSLASTGAGLASRVNPSDSQWEAFWRFMEGCRDWAPEYLAEDDAGGTEWWVLADRDGLRLNSRGSGAYPANWRSFLDAVRRLIGGRDFA